MDSEKGKGRGRGRRNLVAEDANTPARTTRSRSRGPPSQETPAPIARRSRGQTPATDRASQRRSASERPSPAREEDAVAGPELAAAFPKLKAVLLPLLFIASVVLLVDWAMLRNQKSQNQVHLRRVLMECEEKLADYNSRMDALNADKHVTVLRHDLQECRIEVHQLRASQGAHEECMCDHQECPRCDASERSLETARGQLRDYENNNESLRKDLERHKQEIADITVVVDEANKLLSECGANA